MKARFYRTDGGVALEDPSFQRVPGKTQYAVLDHDGVRWFLDTGRLDRDGAVVLKETEPPSDGE